MRTPDIQTAGLGKSIGGSVGRAIVRGALVDGYGDKHNLPSIFRK